MSAEWKAGDVALLRYRHRTGDRYIRALRVANGWWTDVDQDNWSDDDADPRPLVVIDFEDREQVERLERLYLRDEHNDCDDTVECMQAALREFANPTPAKPDEPLGLGAVVEDADGEAWVRFKSATGWWWRDLLGKNSRYADLSVVRVLSPGYTEDGAS